MNPTPPHLQVSTTAHHGEPEVEQLPDRGPWRFTRQRVVHDEHIPTFHELYRAAFDPLKSRSAARQVLTPPEFVDQMTDPRVVKYVAWTAHGQPVGMTTLTNDLDAIPWVSPDYFAEHYPEQWVRQAVYYLGFTLTHPMQRRQRFVETMLRVGIEEMVAERAVLAFDVCAFNHDVLRFGERLESVLADFPGSTLEAIDTQYYSCMSFATEAIAS